uniref:ANF_receptor domain-containing protein n=1 Tax=Macrostomum lignano TaxID=282301 RepID=A0A1I8FUB2_9PLAT
CRTDYCVNNLVIYLRSPALLDGSLLLWDFNNDYDVSRDEEYSPEELLADLSQCKARRVVVFLDSNFAERLAEQLRDLPNVAVLAASSKNNYAPDSLMSEVFFSNSATGQPPARLSGHPTPSLPRQEFTRRSGGRPPLMYGVSETNSIFGNGLSDPRWTRHQFQASILTLPASSRVCGCLGTVKSSPTPNLLLQLGKRCRIQDFGIKARQSNGTASSSVGTLLSGQARLRAQQRRAAECRRGCDSPSPSCGRTGGWQRRRGNEHRAELVRLLVMLVMLVVMKLRSGGRRLQRAAPAPVVLRMTSGGICAGSGGGGGGISMVSGPEHCCSMASRLTPVALLNGCRSCLPCCC